MKTEVVTLAESADAERLTLRATVAELGREAEEAQQVRSLTSELSDLCELAQAADKERCALRRTVPPFRTALFALRRISRRAAASRTELLASSGSSGIGAFQKRPKFPFGVERSSL